MLAKAYVLFAVDTVSALALSYALIYVLPMPIDLAASFLATAFIMRRSISYILTVIKACQAASVYMDDGDDKE